MVSSGSRGPAGNVIPKGYAAGKLQQYTPEQMDLFKRAFSYTAPESQLSQMAAGSDQGFAPHEDYARRQFQEATGQLASRFSGLGMGARRGSGFQNLATQGAQDFASQLAMQRQDLQRQALMDLMGISNTLLGQQPNQNFLIKKQQKQPGFWSRLFGASAPIAGGAAGGLLGGLPGASIGSQLGGSLASGFQPAYY